MFDAILNDEETFDGSLKFEKTLAVQWLNNWYKYWRCELDVFGQMAMTMMLHRCTYEASKSMRARAAEIVGKDTPFGKSIISLKIDGEIVKINYDNKEANNK